MPATTQWVIPAPKKTLVVGVADLAACNDPSAELVTYSLGSCLGIMIYDPASKIGGLLHIMLPDSAIDAAKAAATPLMFVDSGVPRLFQAVCNLGADRRQLVIKVAGGAQFLDAGGIFNIGERNMEALDKILARNGYSIHARDVGGVCSRTVRLDLATGKVSVRCPGVNPYFL
jgi:chemotaxis protein CheD